MEIKYPNITVKLEDGNAFSIIGKVQKEMKRHGVPKEGLDDFLKEATSGDYDNLLKTCMKYVDIE